MHVLLSVVIPAYNEDRTIETLIDRVRAVAIDKEIIVVDDCSSDATRQKLEQLEAAGVIRAFFHERRRAAKW